MARAPRSPPSSIGGAGAFGPFATLGGLAEDEAEEITDEAVADEVDPDPHTDHRPGDAEAG